MSTTCISGAGRAYRLESLDLEMIKSPSSTSWISNSSSPSSTLSESSNCPNSISTRKPRTPRKRPNQTYNEAAAILSTAYPKLFPTKHLTKPCKFTKNPFLFDTSPDLLADDSTFLLFNPQRPNFSIESKGFGFNLFEKPCHSPGEINSNSLQRGFSYEVCDDNQDDFDAESILDEEIGEGIDSILGDLGMENEQADNSNTSIQLSNCCYGYPVGCVGFEFGYGMRRELRAFRNVDEGDWWRFPSVNVVDITTPKLDKIPSDKKKKKKVEKGTKTSPAEPSREDNPIPAIQAPLKSPADESPPLLLKLNYDSVLNAWSDKASPFSGEEPAGNDVQVRLAQIDLFSETGGVREASVQRYKEKRRTRLFSNSKKIRYQVRKVNADRRPRMKGRFVRTPNAPDD